MNVGWIGLGKLGLPCALASATKHVVCGTDVNPEVQGFIDAKSIPYQEARVAWLWEQGYQIQWHGTLRQVVEESDIVFVAVQTPHNPDYEGITRMPETTKDFEYGYLEEVVKQISQNTFKPTTVVIVSTVLPGTTNRLILPRTDRNPNIHLIYSPCFIAMGTAAPDWLHPAMVLAGTRSEKAYADLVEFHRALHPEVPILRMGIESAELAKVLYNTFISMKIVFANTAMELAHKTGADCDEISDALSAATDRIISPAYMRGGMGDGGGCHPRDNIALSHIGRQLALSTDPFRWLMDARDKQAGWLADMALDWAKLSGLPILLCGREYKKNSNLTVGSPAILLENILREKAEAGPNAKVFQDDIGEAPIIRAVYVITCNHDKYATWIWPKGSIVIDPWGYINDMDGVVVIRVGRK